MAPPPRALRAVRSPHRKRSKPPARRQVAGLATNSLPGACRGPQPPAGSRSLPTSGRRTSGRTARQSNLRTHPHARGLLSRPPVEAARSSPRPHQQRRLCPAHPRHGAHPRSREEHGPGFAGRDDRRLTSACAESTHQIPAASTWTTVHLRLCGEDTWTSRSGFVHLKQQRLSAGMVSSW